MDFKDTYRIGLYEKAMPSDLIWEERFESAKEAGYDYIEMSIDETDMRMSRLDWDDGRIYDLLEVQRRAGISIETICFSAQRKYPLGSKIWEKEAKELLRKGIIFTRKLGIRIIQTQGYDCYYEETSDETTRERFYRNLEEGTMFAASHGVMLAMETMENDFMNTVEKAMYSVNRVNSPYLQVYPDIGNISNATKDVTGDLASGKGHIAACAVAADVTSTEELCTIAGTWSINEYISETPVMDGSIAMNSLFAMPGYYLVEECSATSSGNLEWFLQNCMENEQIPEGSSLYELINEKVDSVSPEESDVYFLPFLYGSNAHPLGKGAFIGLTTYHDKAHMLRAIYEGVVYSHRTHIERLLSSRKPPEAIRMAGGAVNSRVWVQMFADALGFPIETVDAKELGALGCGMAAAVAAGVYQDYKEAAAHMVHVSERVYPNPERTAVYQKKYEKYRAVSKALDTVWGQFAV